MKIDFPILTFQRNVIGKFHGDFRDQHPKCIGNTQNCSRGEITVVLLLVVLVSGKCFLKDMIGISDP